MGFFHLAPISRPFDPTDAKLVPIVRVEDRSWHRVCSSLLIASLGKRVPQTDIDAGLLESEIRPKTKKEEKMIRSVFRTLHGHQQPTIRKRSRTRVGGWPLFEVAFGPRWSHGERRGRARAIVAIGDHATGVVAIGGLAQGVVAIGGLSEGLIAVGGCSLGLLVALGGVAVGGVAFGGVALGVLTRGGTAIGVSAKGSSTMSLAETAKE